MIQSRGDMTLAAHLLRRTPTMCLTCGCMDAHLEMGQDNITYEDVQRAAKENGKTVAATFETIDATMAKDRADHPDEYQGEAAGA